MNFFQVCAVTLVHVYVWLSTCLLASGSGALSVSRLPCTPVYRRGSMNRTISIPRISLVDETTRHKGDPRTTTNDRRDYFFFTFINPNTTHLTFRL
jgi:hypothetical protein